MTSVTRHSIVERMLGAARLKVAIYEEVEADKSATVQAMFVVVAVAVATGIGSISIGGLSGLVSGLVVGIVGWALWAWITYFIGTRMFRTPETHADWGQLARTLGFAQTPGILKVFTFVPAIGGTLFLVVSIWQLVAMVIAVRQALDYTSTGRAVGVVIVAFIPYAVLMVILLSLLYGDQ